MSNHPADLHLLTKEHFSQTEICFYYKPYYAMRWRAIYMKRRSDALTCVRFSQYDGQTTCSTPFIVCTFFVIYYY